MKIKTRLLLLASFIGLTSCGSQSPAEKLNKELKTISSWTATTRMVAEALRSGKVPDAYARRTFEAAQQSLQEESQTLEQAADIPAEKREEARARLNNLQEIISQMKRAGEGKDQTALGQLTERLAVEAQAVKAQAEGGAGAR
jgi:hypothetical protein